MLKGETLKENLDWLSTRMKDKEKIALFDELGVTTVKELEARWHLFEVKDRISKEISKRTSIADCTFKLDVEVNGFEPK